MHTTGWRIEIDACYPMARMIEAEHATQWVKDRKTISVRQILICWFPTLFVLLRFETRTFRNMGRFAEWMYHHLGHNEMWDILSRDVWTFRTFHFVTYSHIMFSSCGNLYICIPNVYTLFYANTSLRTEVIRVTSPFLYPRIIHTYGTYSTYNWVLKCLVWRKAS